MARIEKKPAPRKKISSLSIPFTKINYEILAVGIMLIVLGYIALAQEPWDGTMPLVVAPILLVLGYCVVIPLGILYKKRTTPDQSHLGSEQVVKESN